MSFFVNECYICKDTDSPKPCSRCYMISYCGSDHQNKDWPRHKEFCDIIWSIVKENRVSHIYEEFRGVDLDSWTKEKKRMCSTVKSKLKRPLFLEEEQMLLLPRACFICHETRQNLLTSCPVCFCVDFCTEHPTSSQHEKDCLSLKLFREFDGKMQDPDKLRTIFTLIDKIAETTDFKKSSDVPDSMQEYLNQQIRGADYILEQACASNILSMSLTLFNALKKLNLQSASEVLLHVRCDVTDSGVWELLLHFLPNLKLLNIVFIEQKETQKLSAKLCDDCCSKNKKMILETNELLYKNYVKIRIYNKPDVFAYLNAEISKNEDDNLEWKFLLENLSRIGSPLVLTSVTEKMAKMVSESLKSTFWPSMICYEGLNDFGALDPLREWTDGGVSRINQFLIVTKGRISKCKAGIFYNDSFLSKKTKENSRHPLVFFYPNVCHVCRSDNITVLCKFCSMIFYCSEPHRKEDWIKHKDICQVIQRLLKQSGMKNIFDGEIDLMGSQKNSESWLRAKMNLIPKVESQLGNKLKVYQQQMFLFPNTCFVCHESDFHKLKGCECGINLCKRHNDSPSHKELCKDFHLGLQLIEKFKLPDPLPKYKYVSGVKEKLPASIEEFIDLHLTLEKEVILENVSNFNRILIAELLTKPLTLLYALKELMIPETNDSDNSTIVVHVIGLKNLENVYYEFWDVFFNWMHLDRLNVAFVGPKTTTLDLNRTFPDTRERSLSIKSYPVDYEQFVQSSFFEKPDIIVGYNLDIHECENEKCSCRETILTVKRLNVPFVMTSGTKERAQKDHEKLSKVLERSIKYDFCAPNPFASLVPERDFETEGLRFSNKYLLIYCELDQAPNSIPNSKLRKEFLERQEAKKLSDFERVLKGIKIESAPISNIDNAESKTKTFNPRNSFLFDSAKHELRYMLRHYRAASKSTSCKNSRATEDPRSKSDPRFAKNQISEVNLLPVTQDLEQKLESGFAEVDLQLDREKKLEKSSTTEDSESKSESKNEILDEKVDSTEDSKCKSESSPPNLTLFKENLFSTAEDSECIQDSGSEHIWNKIFASISEDSGESGYDKVKIFKDSLFFATDDSTSRSESESAEDGISKKNLLSIVEDFDCNLETKDFTEDSESNPKSGYVQGKILKEKLSFSEDSASKSESGLDEEEISKKKFLSIAEEDFESKLESEVANGEIFKKDLMPTTEDSLSKLESATAICVRLNEDLLSTIEVAESKSKSESTKGEISKESLLFLTEDSASKSESGSANENLEPKSESGFTEDEISKMDALSTREQNLESKSECKIANGDTSKDNLWLATEDSENYVFKEHILSLSENLSKFTIQDSVTKSEESASAFCETLKENLLHTNAECDFKSKSGFNNGEASNKDLLSQTNQVSESKSVSGYAKDEILKESVLYLAEDSVSKPEPRPADVAILNEDSESRSESGSFTDEMLKNPSFLLMNSESVDRETLKEDTVPTIQDFDSKSESETAKDNIFEKHQLSLVENSLSNSQPESPKGKIPNNLFDTTENCKSESVKNKTLKENLLPTAEVSGLKAVLSRDSVESLVPSVDLSNSIIGLGSHVNKTLKENRLFLTEDSKSKSQSGSLEDEILKEHPLSSTKDSESHLESRPPEDEILIEVSKYKSESVSPTNEMFKEHLLSFTENSGSKSESKFVNDERLPPTEYDKSRLDSVSSENEILKKKLLFSMEDSESKSKSLFLNSEILKDGLLPTTENSELTLESESVDELLIEKSLLKLTTTEDPKCNSEKELSNDKLLKENFLFTTKDFELKSESEPSKEIESEYEKANGDKLKNFLPIIENSEFRLESGSAKVEIFKECLLPTTEDSEFNSECRAADDLVKENLFLILSTTEDSGETGPPNELFKENLLFATEDSESKLESVSPKEEIIKENLSLITEDSEFKSESGSSNEEKLKEELSYKNFLSATENFESKSESGSAKDEMFKKNLLSTTDDSEFKLESRPADDELLKENLLLKEEIKRLKKNEKLIESENFHLKEEVRRLQKL